MADGIGGSRSADLLLVRWRWAAEPSAGWLPAAWRLAGTRDRRHGAAHELACGGVALGNHVNDSVAREFFLNHRWLDFTQAGPRNLFWLLCFGPMAIQMMIGIWWRRKMERRAKQS